MSTKIWILAIIALTIGLCNNSKLRWFGGAPDRISALGYEVEVHKVTTADGYILELHRIPFSPTNKVRGTKKPVMLFVHGVFSSSDCFLINGVHNSLGFQAANEGYDVWLLNSRGNRYSSNHVNLSTSSTKFWSFSFHEMAIYDLPATIDYIIEITGQQTLHYVGHSMASHIYLAFLSEKPEYNRKVKSGHLLSAGVNPAETALNVAAFGQIGTLIANILDYGSFGVYQYFFIVNYFLWMIGQTSLGKALSMIVLDLYGGHSSTLNMVTI